MLVTFTMYYVSVFYSEELISAAIKYVNIDFVL
jgi:hypothetical protein